MSRCRLFLVLLLGSLAGLLFSLNGCSGGSQTTFVDQTPPPPSSQYIQHVVVIFQENRTPDNLFQDPVLISRGADIASSGVNSLKQTITLSPIALANNYDLSHAHSAFEKMYDGGKMDGADLISVSCAAGNPSCAPANPQFMYVNQTGVQPYFALAEHTFGDRMFLQKNGFSWVEQCWLPHAKSFTSALLVSEPEWDNLSNLFLLTAYDGHLRSQRCHDCMSLWSRVIPGTEFRTSAGKC